MRVLLAVVFVLFGLGANCAGCPPTPTPTPVSDGSISDSSTPSDPTPSPVRPDVLLTRCQQMCLNLNGLGCAESVKYGLIKCGETCEHVLSSGIINLNINCVISAASKAEVQKCGIKCQ